MNRKKGQYGELKALQYLRNHGYQILKYNVTHRNYQIDIVATKNDIVHIVEVKYRTSYLLLSVSQSQKSCINEYIASNWYHKYVSRDVIYVHPKGIEHYCNVF